MRVKYPIIIVLVALFLSKDSFCSFNLDRVQITLGYPYGMTSFWNDCIQGIYDGGVAQNIPMSMTKSWGFAGGINIPTYFEYFDTPNKWYWGAWGGYMYSWMSKCNWKIDDKANNIVIEESIQPTLHQIYIAPSLTYLSSDTNAERTYFGIAAGLSYDIVNMKTAGGWTNQFGPAPNYVILGPGKESGIYPIVFLFAYLKSFGVQLNFEPQNGWNSMVYFGLIFELN